MTLRYPMCPPPRETTRRNFMTQAAAVAAGGTALALAIVAPGSATASPASPLVDPIFAAIEAHKVAKVAFAECVSIHIDLESAIPRDRRKSSIDAHESKIIETDDPRWIESERDVDRLGDAEIDAACKLLMHSAMPTTMAGVVALLEYAVVADTDGYCWPVDLQSDDGTEIGSWHHFLVEMVACVLSDMMEGDGPGMVRT